MFKESALTCEAHHILRWPEWAWVFVPLPSFCVRSLLTKVFLLRCWSWPAFAQPELSFPPPGKKDHTKLFMYPLFEPMFRLAEDRNKPFSWWHQCWQEDSAVWISLSHFPSSGPASGVGSCSSACWPGFWPRFSWPHSGSPVSCTRSDALECLRQSNNG